MVTFRDAPVIEVSRKFSQILVCERWFSWLLYSERSEKNGIALAN